MLFVVRPYSKLFELNEKCKDGIGAYWWYSGYGPAFGSGTDLYLTNGSKNYCSAGSSAPKTYTFTSEELFGESKQMTRINDYEVFSVISEI